MYSGSLVLIYTKIICDCGECCHKERGCLLQLCIIRLLIMKTNTYTILIFVLLMISQTSIVETQSNISLGTQTINIISGQKDLTWVNTFPNRPINLFYIPGEHGNDPLEYLSLIIQNDQKTLFSVGCIEMGSIDPISTSQL